MAIKVGDRAPDFTLMSNRGEPVQLQRLLGKPVVLYFLSQGQYAWLYKGSL